MAKDNKKAPIQKDTGIEQEEKRAKTSKTLEDLTKLFKENPNRFLRQTNFVYMRKILNRPDLTWVEFCDEKIKAHTEHWEAMKSNPLAGKKVKLLDADALAKEEAKLAKLQAQLQRKMAVIEASKAKLA